MAHFHPTNQEAVEAVRPSIADECASLAAVVDEQSVTVALVVVAYLTYYQ
jgi:hypothetical protein